MKDEFKKNLHVLGIVIAGISFLATVLYLPNILAILSTVFSAFYPFVLGLMIAFILNLPLNFFEKKVFKRLNKPKYKFWTKIKRGVCLLLSIILILGILTVAFSFIIPQFVDAIKKFISSLPTYMASLNNTITNLSNRFHLSLDTDKLSINWENISATVLNYINTNKSAITVGTVDAIVAIFNGLFDFILGFVFAIYILVSKESLGKLAKRILFSLFKRKKAEKILSISSMSSKVFSGFVAGQCIEVLLIGTLCFIGMLIFKMPYPLMISCIIALTAFIPVFGALIGTSISAFIILLENPIKALWFVVFIIVLQQIESNAIYPKIMGKSVGLPGIWVLLAVTVGGSLFGIPGMLLGVPSCSVLYCLLESWLHSRLTNRKICTHTFVEKDDCPPTVGTSDDTINEKTEEETPTVTVKTSFSKKSDE